MKCPTCHLFIDEGPALDRCFGHPALPAAPSVPAGSLLFTTAAVASDMAFWEEMRRKERFFYEWAEKHGKKPPSEESMSEWREHMFKIRNMSPTERARVGRERAIKLQGLKTGDQIWYLDVRDVDCFPATIRHITSEFYLILIATGNSLVHGVLHDELEVHTNNVFNNRDTVLRKLEQLVQRRADRYTKLLGMNTRLLEQIRAIDRS